MITDSPIPPITAAPANHQNLGSWDFSEDIARFKRKGGGSRHSLTFVDPLMFVLQYSSACLAKNRPRSTSDLTGRLSYAASKAMRPPAVRNRSGCCLSANSKARDVGLATSVSILITTQLECSALRRSLMPSGCASGSKNVQAQHRQSSTKEKKIVKKIASCNGHIPGYTYL